MTVNLEQIIGRHIRIVNDLDETFEGTIYSFNTSCNLITVQSSRDGRGLASFIIINTSFIKRFTVRERDDGILGPKCSSGRMCHDVEDIEHVLKRNFSNAKRANVILHPVITPEDHTIFDLLDLTFPDVKWQGHDILLMKNIKLKPPYKVKNIVYLNSGEITTTSTNLLERILQRGWDQIAEDNGRKGG